MNCEQFESSWITQVLNSLVVTAGVRLGWSYYVNIVAVSLHHFHKLFSRTLSMHIRAILEVYVEYLWDLEPPFIFSAVHFAQALSVSHFGGGSHDKANPNSEQVPLIISRF
jgi:hypothetical protein